MTLSVLFATGSFLGSLRPDAYTVRSTKWAVSLRPTDLTARTGSIRFVDEFFGRTSFVNIYNKDKVEVRVLQWIANRASK